MIFDKKSTFFSYLFLEQKKGQKEPFFDVLDRKECFLHHKSKVLQKSKKTQHFAKGLVHGFCQKIDLFLKIFFFEQKSKKETFFDILNRK